MGRYILNKQTTMDETTLRAKMEEWFEVADADKNGACSKAEMTTFADCMIKFVKQDPNAPHNPERFEAEWEKAEKNGDGEVTTAFLFENIVTEMKGKGMLQ